jgi:hypothetical protein
MFRALTTLLPRDRIRLLALELGAVQRPREPDGVVLVDALALSSASATIARYRAYAERTCARRRAPGGRKGAWR